MPDIKSTSAQFYKAMKILHDQFEQSKQHEYSVVSMQVLHSEAIVTCFTSETFLLLYTLATGNNVNGYKDITTSLWHFIAFKILPIAFFQSLLIIESLSTLFNQLKIINEQEMHDITNKTELSHCLDLLTKQKTSTKHYKYFINSKNGDNPIQKVVEKGFLLASFIYGMADIITTNSNTSLNTFDHTILWIECSCYFAKGKSSSNTKQEIIRAIKQEIYVCIEKNKQPEQKAIIDYINKQLECLTLFQLQTINLLLQNNTNDNTQAADIRSALAESIPTISSYFLQKKDALINHYLFSFISTALSYKAYHQYQIKNSSLIYSMGYHLCFCVIILQKSWLINSISSNKNITQRADMGDFLSKLDFDFIFDRHINRSEVDFNSITILLLSTYDLILSLRYIKDTLIGDNAENISLMLSYSTITIMVLTIMNALYLLPNICSDTTTQLKKHYQLPSIEKIIAQHPNTFKEITAAQIIQKRARLFLTKLKTIKNNRDFKEETSPELEISSFLENKTTDLKHIPTTQPPSLANQPFSYFQEEQPPKKKKRDKRKALSNEHINLREDILRLTENDNTTSAEYKKLMQFLRRLDNQGIKDEQYRCMRQSVSALYEKSLLAKP